MAHSCPICYQTCYCHGDIDDCCFEGTPEEAACDHCCFDCEEPKHAGLCRDPMDYDIEEGLQPTPAQEDGE